MKPVFLTLVAVSIVLFACGQQDKSKRASPPAKVTQKLSDGTTISIDYSQPSLKGRTPGKDVDPMEGKVWRAGANEATVFEADNEVKIQGQPLAAGKYALFMLAEPGEWTIIFNKKWDQWGTQYEKNKDQDVLKVKVKPGMTESSIEKLTYEINKDGIVSLLWANMKIDFKVN